MDKETLSHYGWIVVLVLVLSIMIALATPFGEYVKVSATNTLTSFIDTNQGALSIIDPPPPPSSFQSPQAYNYETPIADPLFFAEDADDTLMNMYNVIGFGAQEPAYRTSFVPNQIVTFKTDLLKEAVYGDSIYAKFKYSNGVEYIAPLTKDGEENEDFDDYLGYLYVNVPMNELSLPNGTTAIKATVTSVVGDFTAEYSLMHINQDGIEGWMYTNEDDGSAVMVVKNARAELDEDGYADNVVPEEGSAIVAVMGAVGGTLPIHKLTVAGKDFIVNEKPTSENSPAITNGVWKIGDSYHNEDQWIYFLYNTKTDGTSFEVSEGDCAFVWYTNMDIADTMFEGLESIELLGTEFKKPFTGITQSLSRLDFYPTSNSYFQQYTSL